MDLFEEWLLKEEEKLLVKRALTDASYKKVDRSLSDKDVNKDLATYGDAVIKLCFSELLLGKVEKLTVEKAKLESDSNLVRRIGKHYEMLKHIHFDEKDEKKAKDYGESEPLDKRLPKTYKYIATAVEAMVGVIYIETKKLEPIIRLLDTWIKLSKENE